MSRSSRPLLSGPLPPFSPMNSPFSMQATDSQAGPPSSYNVRPPQRASYSRNRTLDVHQLLRSLREDLLEGMEHANALELCVGPYSSHPSQALATLERAWARAFAASELLRTGEWAPDSLARSQHAQAVAGSQQDTGMRERLNHADQRSAMNEDDESMSNTAPSDLPPNLGTLPVRGVDDGGIVREDMYRTESPPLFEWPPEPEESPAYTPTLSFPTGAPRHHYLDEIIRWLQEHGEEAVHERARRAEDLRREVAREHAREELHFLIAAIQAFERDYHRLLPEGFVLDV